MKVTFYQDLLKNIPDNMTYRFKFNDRNSSQRFMVAVNEAKIGVASRTGSHIVVKLKNNENRNILESLAKDTRGKLDEMFVTKNILPLLSEIRTNHQTESITLRSGENISVTPKMASYILNTHDSLNESNQKHLRDITSKDKNNFLRVLDFSVKLERGS